MIVLSFVFYHKGWSQEIRISEVMSSNSTTIADQESEFNDWIELYNASDRVINLAGYHLSDDPDNPRKWKFEDYDFQPGSYLLVWASGKDLQAGPLAPTQVQGLLSWFSAGDIDKNDAAQIRQEGSVLRLKSWLSRDKAHVAYQETEEKQPELHLNKIKGLAAVHFDGKGQALISDLQPPTGNSGRTLMLVAANADLDSCNQSSNNYFLHYGSYGLNQAYGISLSKKSLGGKIGNNYWSNQFYGLAAMDENVHTITVKYNEHTDNLYMDGVFAGSNYVELNTGTSQNLNIGSRLGGSADLYGGDIAEIVVFDTAIGRCDQQRIENYFARKYQKPMLDFHSNFNISADGETILLTDPNSAIIDQLIVPALTSNISYGLQEGQAVYYAQPSPGKANSTGFTEILSPPVFSLESGIYSDTISLNLSCADPEALILYTLDGSRPDYNNLEGFDFSVKYSYENCNEGVLSTRSSKTFIYRDSLVLLPKYGQADDIALIPTSYMSFKEPKTPVNKASVVRACTWKPTAIPGETITKTYLIDSLAGSRYHLPLVSIVTDDYHLFDYDTGIYVPGKLYDQTCSETTPDANYKQDEWERPASFELFSPDGKLLFQQNAGIRIHGYYSTNRSRKSLRLTARKEYDEEGLFNYPLIPGLKQESALGSAGISVFNSFLLRNSGNEWYTNLFLDAMVHNLVKPLDAMDEQASYAVVHFINGTYWGIMNFREKHSKYYFAHHYAMHPDEVIIANARTSSISSGYEYEYRHYTDMERFAKQNDLAVQENYDYLQTLMDVDNYLNHFAVQIYINNTDFLGNNRKFWRKRTPEYIPEAPLGHDGRWRWIFYDVDQSFRNPEEDRLAYTTVNDFNSTVLLRKLLERKEVEYTFINRICDHMNASFKPGRVVAVIDSMAEQMAQDFPEHILRWGFWNDDQNIQELKDFAQLRPQFMRNHLKNRFQLTDTAIVKLQTNPVRGKIRINSLLLDEHTPGMENPRQPYPWKGLYFAGVPIQIEAIPNPGYVFSHWEGSPDLDTALLNLDPAGGLVLIAHFDTLSTVERSLIHYWHFNSFAGTVSTVPADYSFVSEAYITYPGRGEGYMDERSHRSKDPVPDLNLKMDETPEKGAVLRVRNPASTRELIIAAPSSCHHNIVLSYATTRTLEGPTHQCLYYSVDSGLSWLRACDAYYVPLLDPDAQDYGYVLKSFDFSGNKQVENNPGLMFKILFMGEGAGNTSGNARFDNMSLEGVTVLPELIRPNDQRLAPGTYSERIVFEASMPGCIFEWTNNQPAIGLPESGSGNIEAFMAQNTSDSILEATIRVTPVLYGCAGLAQSFSIKVGRKLLEEDVVLSKNPVKNELEVCFSLFVENQLEMSLSDVLGRTVLRVQTSSVPAGKSCVSVPVSGLSPGIYWARIVLSVNGMSEDFIRKMVVQP